MSNTNGRKKNSKGKNYKYAIAFLDDTQKIKYRKYFKTYEDLTKSYSISRSTLYRILKNNNGKTKKYKWYIFEKVNINEELGDYLNKNPDKQKTN